MNELSSLEHNLLTQLVPLIIKNPVLRLANYLAERGITAAFSNVGKVAMPPEMARYIDSFHVFYLHQPAAGLYVLLWRTLRCQLFLPFCQYGYPAGLFPAADC